MSKDPATKLLAIEDDSAVLDSIVAYFEDNEYQVLPALGGQRGLEVFRSEKPDIVVTDLRMPGVSGLDVIATITVESPQTPIVVVSGTGVLADAIKAIRLGAWDYVTKPISDMAVLNHVTEKALERGRLLRENRRHQERLEIEVQRRTAQLEEANRALAREIEVRRAAETELGRLNEELEARVAQRTGQLNAANRELESFAYSVSHDLRAPLRSIDGFSQILVEDHGHELGEAGRALLDRVRAGSRRMDRLINDLLKLSRITRADLRRDSVDLSQLAHSIVLELRENEPERNVEVIVTQDLVVSGDRELLRVALENLFGNAWKFTARLDRSRIEFGRAEIDGEEAFFVADNGAGFDMAYAEKLFGAFQRLHGAADFPGTGVGLATVQRIIHRHGGRIWATGAVGQGATFYFQLRS